MRHPNTFTKEENEKKLALFIAACKFGVETRLEPFELAGILAGMSEFLRYEERPLEFFVENPEGTHAYRSTIN